MDNCEGIETGQLTFMGSTKGAVPEGASPWPSGSKDF